MQLRVAAAIFGERWLRTTLLESLLTPAALTHYRVTRIAPSSGSSLTTYPYLLLRFFGRDQPAVPTCHLVAIRPLAVWLSSGPPVLDVCCANSGWNDLHSTADFYGEPSG